MMRILLVGFIVLVSWSALSTYIYICKIKGLCSEPRFTEMAVFIQGDTIASDTLRMPLEQQQVIIPEILVIYFAFDKSDFNHEEVTEDFIYESNTYLTQNSNARLSITGHTDAIGSIEYNTALGERRAKSVQDYFQSKGLPGDKIITESRGETEPVDDNNTTAGRANNRRTVITIKK